MPVAHAAERVGDYEIAALTTGRFKENCYIVSHAGGDCVVIDPGSDEAFLHERLDAGGLRPQKILLTHGHFDHLGAVEGLMKRYGIVCQVHAAEERLVRQAGTYAFRFAREALRVPRGLTFFAAGVEALDWADRTVEVIPTPGHTAGSVALAVDRAFVFTGDTLFRERIGPTTYPESDPEAIVSSVARLLERLPDTCVIFPGHGRPWTVGAARAWWRGLTGPAEARAIF